MFWNNFVSLFNKQGMSPNSVAAKLVFGKSAVTYWKNGTIPNGKPLAKKGLAPEVYRAIELYRQERSVQADREDSIRQGCCEEHGAAADDDVKKEPSRASKTTVKDLYEQYMAAKKTEIRETTWDKSRRNLEYYIMPSLVDVKLSKLNASRLQQWKNDIGCMELSTVTKQNVYRELSAMLNYAVRMELIPKNPLSGVGTFRGPNFEKPEEKLHYYTAEQYHRFIAEAKKDEYRRYYVFFSIAFYTGMRKGEINALRWTDIEGNIIHVRRSVTQKLKGDDV